MAFPLDLIQLIEKHPVAIGTTMPAGKPNITPVAYVKVVGDSQILITDNFMNQLIKDIQNNPSVTLAVWNPEMSGYKLIGQAEYFTSGPWFEKVKSIPENKNMPCKGAVLVTVTKFFPTK
ncbi:MAG: pyridoxamine 5'-phosphate oxidase family protein [Candidatus Beckwithbacteria bacterium]